MKFVKTDSNPLVQQFREQLYLDFSEPLDGMWEVLYIGGADIYLINENGADIGYLCIGEGKVLNQLYLQAAHRFLMKYTVSQLLKTGLATSAQLSSNEMVAFNACLFHAKSTAPHTLCYRFSPEQQQSLRYGPVSLRLVKEGDIPAVKSFLKSEAGFDDNFGYTENLLGRKEMYLVEEAAAIIATGECRMSDTQSRYADVGMIVHQSKRKQGLGTRMLVELIRLAQGAGRIPICSTTQDNVGSQKAIERAGFCNQHVIFDIQF